MHPSKRDTCETQAALAAQSSRIDTVRSGNPVTYKPAPCPAKPSPAKGAATS